jgi:hypothetical protein
MDKSTPAPGPARWTNKLGDLPLPSIGVILWAATLLRLVSIAAVRSFLHPVTWEFGPLAKSLAAGLGYSEVLDNGMRVPAIYMPPAYSYFLALFYWIWGDGAGTHIAIEIIQAGCGTLLVYLVYRLAALLYGQRAGLAAACLVAVFPTQIYMCNEFHGINIYIVLGTAAVFFLTRYVSLSHSWKDVIAAGLCMGTLMLFRGEAPGLLALYALILLLLGRRQALLPTTAFVLVASACLAPWIVRNYQTFHRIIPVCASGGWNLYVGNSPQANGSQHNNKLWYPMPPAVESAFDAIQPGPYERIQRNDALGRFALNYIRTHPLNEMKLALKKLWIFFVFDPAHDKGRNPVYWIPSVLLTFFAVCGALRRERKLLDNDLFIGGSIAFTIAVSVAMFALPRYKIAIDPLIMIIAANLLAAGRSSEAPGKPADSKIAIHATA